MLWFSLLGCIGHKCKVCFSIFLQNLISLLHEKDPTECLDDVSGVHKHKIDFIQKERAHEE